MQVPQFHREFSMSVASVADSIGISMAGVSAIFIHKYICAEFIGYVGPPSGAEEQWP